MENKGALFTSLVKKRERRSTFDLSHDVKLSLDMGSLVPVTCIDCLPGDNITINTSQMLRMAPLVSPVMHKIDVFLEYFFVPNRILWPNWETFITGSRNGKQVASIDAPAFPVLQPFQNENFLNGNGTLADYLGLPSETDFPDTETPSNAIRVSALPFAAYQRIYDEYYRDQNLVESMYDYNDGEYWDIWPDYNKLPDGDLSGHPSLDIMCRQLGTLRTRAWEHDYFTSALPWAQKGEVVQIPLTGDLEIGFKDPHLPAYFKSSTQGTTPEGNNDPILNRQPGEWAKMEISGGTAGFSIDNTDNLELISSGSGGGLTIADLRAAIKLQEWLETNARGGSRYFESIYAHFGVKTPDNRLQRPEFIGSSRSNMVISEVLQTSSPQAETDTPQGNMSGHGQSVGSSRNFNYYCQEHGYIIGILSLMPKTAYQQGIPRHFLKTFDKLEYYFPEFAHLGEQEVLNMELYAGGNVGDAQGTFGYTPRYAEYKFMNSRVCGDFRDTLAFWHMGRIFEDTPALNGAFITSDPTKRIFAVQDLPQDGSGEAEGIRDYHSIYAHVFHDVKASRLMPKYGTPSTGGI